MPFCKKPPHFLFGPTTGDCNCESADKCKRDAGTYWDEEPRKEKVVTWCQSCHEMHWPEMERLRARVAELEEAVRGLLMEWDRLSRYGSPMAKAANERVAAARAVLAKAGEEK